MYSMTGYGKGTASSDGREITVELKSVNHRFLDVAMRLPRHLMFLEDAIRQYLQANFSRGHIDVFVNYRNTRSDAKSVSVNTQLLKAYVDAARAANAEIGLADDLSLSKVLKLPDVTDIVEADDNQDAVLELCTETLKEASEGLKAMRLSEGERLRADLTEKMTVISDLTNQISLRAPLVVEEYRDKLNDRIAKLVDSLEIDKSRLATEVALFADKAAIDEEIVRLRSHISHMNDLFSDSEPSGRRMDFVVQEMNREFNTIGSKANDSALTDLVLSGKTEIEKIREQIQNIE